MKLIKNKKKNIDLEDKQMIQRDPLNVNAENHMGKKNIIQI